MALISHGGGNCELATGKTVFDYADELAVQVPTSCGRMGHCHECVVEVKRGMEALCPRTEPESFLRGDYRLACQAVIRNADCDVEFALLRRRPQILTSTPEKPLELDPLVTHAGGAVFYNGERIDTYRGHLYGIAIDLGTTTVVVELVDLETGAGLCLSSFDNPQRFGGSDVMNRISYDSGRFRGELHKAIISAVNHELQQMCRDLHFSRQEIYEVVVTGNSTMRDLFFNLDVQSIGQRPYKSVVEHEYHAGLRETTALVEKAHKLAIWAHPHARIFGAPLIASHVGADTAADLAAIDMESQREIVMLVDVGTNTEVVVGYAGRMMAASCPAGPAFEGGLVKYGMPGCDGAIESIRLKGDRVEYRTIGDVPPQGICGSGLIDLLAELRRHGRMTPKGVFRDRAREIMVAPEQGITLSREDASNLAQAKAANYCGQFIVLRKFGIDPGDVTKLYLAGGFANYVDVRNAIDIGFLAPVPEDRIVKVGNASIQGAREMLLSRRKRQSVEGLVKGIEHVELETTPDFFEVFVEGCQFKPMPNELVPLATVQGKG
ncbi:MAG: ferredoxin [Acidobacteria bacterium]|nr:MAG: ferredoxin [Acidobacteriota bacterium]